MSEFSVSTSEGHIPEDYLRSLTAFVVDNPPSNVTVTVSPNDNPESDNNMEQDIEDDSPEDQGTICTILLCKITCTYCRQFSNTPSRVSTPESVSYLRGEGHCPHCFCMPCITELPPDFWPQRLVRRRVPGKEGETHRHNMMDGRYFQSVLLM